MDIKEANKSIEDIKDIVNDFINVKLLLLKYLDDEGKLDEIKETVEEQGIEFECDVINIIPNDNGFYVEVSYNDSCCEGMMYESFDIPFTDLSYFIKYNS